MKKKLFFTLFFSFCFLFQTNISYGIENSLENELDFIDNIKGIIYMEGEFLDDDILKISIIGKDIIKPIIGISFHLKYDEKKIDFLRYEPGVFLEKGGKPFYLVTNLEEQNKIIFGSTLRRDDSFPLEGGLIADFYFQINGKMPFLFEFQRGILSSLDTVRQDLDKIVWENLFLSSENEKTWVGDVFDSIKLKSGDFSLGKGFTSVFLGAILILTILFLTIWKPKQKAF